MSLKIISTIFGIAIVLLGGAVGYGQLQADQKNTSEQVNEVKGSVKEVSYKTAENEKVNIEQSVILQQTVQLIQEIREDLKK